jgi:hypothetical protein
VTYDARGRVTQTVYPDRTVSTNYASGGDPLTATVTDSTDLPGVTPVTSEASTSTVDLLGEATSSTDVWGTVTDSAFDRMGRLLTTTVTPPSGSTGIGTQSLGYTYNFDGQLAQETLGGDPIAIPGYDAAQRLTGVSYPSGSGNAGNGTSLSSVAYSPTGAVQSDAWSFVSGSAFSDVAAFSQSGRVLQDAIVSGSTTYTSTYSYDAAGRLILADDSLAAPTVLDDKLAYAYASSGGCGANTAAGKDGDRTGFTETLNTVVEASVGYCYDNADRLTSDTVSSSLSGASPLLASALASTGGSPSLVYDARGNITTLGDETMAYDQEDRHLSTHTSASPAATVAYTRDASGGVVAMETDTTGGSDTTVRYSGGGGIQFTVSSTGVVQEAGLSLPGGVTVSVQGTTGTQVWSYPDLHGDDVATADQSGARGGGGSALFLYDPFGDPVDVATGLVGTVAGNMDVPDNTTTTGASFGWGGSHDKQYQHTGDIATIEMGARQ